MCEKWQLSSSIVLPHYPTFSIFLVFLHIFILLLCERDTWMDVWMDASTWLGSCLHHRCPKCVMSKTHLYLWDSLCEHSSPSPQISAVSGCHGNTCTAAAVCCCLFLSAHDSADLDAARWSPRSHSCCGRKEEVEQVASRSSAFVSVLAQEQIISREPSSAAAALLLLSFPHHAAPINLFCLQFAHLQVVAEQCVRCLRPL